jgi:TolB-like protein
MSFFHELKRRNVFRMGIAYLLLAWVLLQGVDFALEVIGSPDWILQVFVLAAAVGLPVVLIFSWIFEMTPEGIRRESQIDRSRSITPHTARKLDRMIIGALALAVAILLVDRFIASPPERAAGLAGPAAAAGPGEVTADTPPLVPATVTRSIAVLPFAVMSAGEDDGYFADGLTEEILNALSQLPELLVTARTSAFALKGQDLPVQDIAARLGVRHIVEGSVRRSGERLRVTAQLIRAEDGFHLWSENYDSTAEDAIDVQEDIAEQIALAMDVVLDDDKREAMRRAGLRDVAAFIALQKGNELMEKAHGDPDMIPLLSQANTHFERVAERVPAYAPAYTAHSDLYIHLLMNQATGQSLEGARAEDLAAAMSLARADFEAAARHARSDEERDNAELDLAFISSEWQGMPANIERFIGQRGCDESTWIENISVSFGYAPRLLPRFEEYISCNPLYTSVWRRVVRANLWAGNPAGALEVARQGAQRAPGPWLSSHMVAALVAQGEFDAAEQAVAAQLHDSGDVLIHRMMIAAARADDATINALLVEWAGHPSASDKYWNVIFHAWLGKQDDANRIAAQIDTHPFGSPALSTIALWCLCGAPWDLAATPAFAANLKESGLPWPPNSPIRFPLKAGSIPERLSDSKAN